MTKLFSSMSPSSEEERTEMIAMICTSKSTIATGAISWVSKLQSVVATSTTKTEYVVATQANKEAIWLKMLLEEFEHKQEYAYLFCDRVPCILQRILLFTQEQNTFGSNTTSFVRKWKK
ncbi:hypothetical protein GQ457_01G022860 [Hibiscus cannabinus]